MTLRSRGDARGDRAGTAATMATAGIAFAAGIAALGAAFAASIARTRREWASGDALSRTTAGLITVTWLLALAVFALALAWSPLSIDAAEAPALVIGAALGAGGLALAAPGYLPFGSLRHLYGMDRGGLITDGVFRVSRNPQYTGIGLLLVGAAAIARSPLGLAVALAYWAGIRVWLTVEEAHLERTFGSPYRDYRARVARFLGRSRAT